MIVTIDGPAGSGKSTAAADLASRLGYRFLDTGAMYRAVTLAGHQQGVDLANENALARVAEDAKLQLDGTQVLLNGADVTQEIRTFEITSLVRHAADNLAVRDHLTNLQRQFAKDAASAGTGVVTEGRDQATVVFPDAECKIYLTASEQARAKRRHEDLLDRGEKIDYEKVLEKQRRRDEQDLRREHGGLALAEDSITVMTDGLTPEEVVKELEEIVRQRKHND